MRWFGILTVSLLLSACSFPEDDKISGPWEVSSEDQRIQFKTPLQVSDEGLQTLYLVVDGSSYEETTQSVDEFVNAPPEVAFSLRHKDNHQVWQPEVVIGDEDGNTLEMAPTVVMNPTDDPSLIAVGFSEQVGPHTRQPPLREIMSEIHWVELQGNYPATVKALVWKVSQHPDLHHCMGACPARWLPGFD
ncbi:hypothetical protein [Halospina sp. K52047b]|uniref:hypothetical protein n=1 Tax=Halospina sp. K52047b TaxID=2614160 RepID=UPI00124A8C7E|nr:hypothetical protein [Halospina sp. K52047b]KAA8978324.1 hypothetical protein F3089_14005 [Halospina sp. K52047b]